jgi:hypothetical protein
MSSPVQRLDLPPKFSRVLLFVCPFGPPHLASGRCLGGRLNEHLDDTWETVATGALKVERGAGLHAIFFGMPPPWKSADTLIFCLLCANMVFVAAWLVGRVGSICLGLDQQGLGEGCLNGNL